MKKMFITILTVLIIASTVFAGSENDDLIHYFPFDNNITDLITLESATQNGSSVSYTNSITGCGTAMALDGNSYLEFDMEGLEEWTIAFWINIDQLATKGMHLVGKKADIFEGDVGNYNFVTGISPVGLLNHQYETRGSNTDYRVSYSKVNPGTWYHVIQVRKTDGTHSIYINGELAVKSIHNAAPCANEMPLLIGGRIVENAVNLKGKIDELRIYNVGKDDDEFINNVYTASEGLSCNPQIIEVTKEVVKEVPDPQLVTEVTQLNTQLDQLESQLAAADIEISNLKKQIVPTTDTQLLNEITQLNTQLDQSDTENEQLSAKLITADEEIAKLKKEKDELLFQLNKSGSVSENNVGVQTIEVEKIVYVDREVPVEKIVYVDREVPVEKKYTEFTDTQLTQDFLRIWFEAVDRKNNSRGIEYDGDIKNDSGNHYGNDSADNNANDQNNKHNEK